MAASVLRVLTYHRVLTLAGPGAPRPASVSATPAEFDRQMRHLARRYRVVSAEEVLRAVRERRALPPRAVLVTFDDAYEDFGDVAWPILRRHALPATLFVPTAFPDRPEREFWWDRLHRALGCTARQAIWTPTLGRLPLDTAAAREVARRLIEARVKAMPHEDAMRLLDDVHDQLGDAGAPTSRVLGWQALRELAGDGVALAPHTRTHPSLPHLPPAQALAEIRDSREELRRETGSELPVLAYPFGAHDDGVVRLVREAGVELALTCLDGHNRLDGRGGTDPLRLRRTNVSTRSTGMVFRARLYPLAPVVDRWRHRGERVRAAGWAG